MRILQRLRQRLKSWPHLWKLAKQADSMLRLSPTLRMLSARLFDSQSKYWKKIAVEELRRTWDSRFAAGSEYLTTVLDEIKFASLLELGSNCGNRLFTIAALNPTARLVGIDISNLAVEYGNQWLAAEGVNNARLERRRIEDLDYYGEGSFDIVFSWASLIYIPPRRIARVLENILRIAARAVVLIEMQSGSADRRKKGTYHDPGNWKRNYLALLEDLGVNPSRLKCVPVAKEIWSPGGGGAACITCIKP